MITKFVTQFLAVRLLKVLCKLISTEQTGYIKGRFSGQNIRLIQDVIYFCIESGHTDVIQFVDFKKAFDTLEIPF